MRTPTGHSPRQHALCVTEQVVGLDDLQKGFPDPAALWLQNFLTCERLTSPDPLGCWIYCAAQPAAHRFAFSCQVCLTQWGSWEKPGMTSKEAKPWLFFLGEEHKPPEHCSAVPGAGSHSQPCARGSLNRGFGLISARLPRHSLAPRLCPGGQLGWGSWRHMVPGSIQETPSRSAICWVPAVQPGQLLQLPWHRFWAFSSLPRLTGNASAQGPEGACAKQELAGFTQPDRPWNAKQQESYSKESVLFTSLLHHATPWNQESPQGLSAPPSWVVRMMDWEHPAGLILWNPIFMFINNWNTCGIFRAISFL